MRLAAKAIIAYVAIVAATVFGLTLSANASPKAAPATPTHTTTQAVLATPQATPAPTPQATPKATPKATPATPKATPAPVYVAPHVTTPAHALTTPAPVYAPKALPTPKALPKRTPAAPLTPAMACGFNAPQHAALWNSEGMTYTRQTLASEHTTARYMGSVMGGPAEPKNCAAIPANRALTIADANNRWDFYSLSK